MQSEAAPTYDGDFWDDKVILDPYPTYRDLRNKGPVVWMRRHDAWAITRHEPLRRALTDAATFSSAEGVSMNNALNEAGRGTMLSSDDPEHLVLRRLFAKPLLPKALQELRPRLKALADVKVDELTARGSFDAVADLARFLPVTVVVELVGLDQEGRDNMLDWAAAIFDGMGPPENRRTVEGLEIMTQVIGYCMERIDRCTMIPGGWGEALFLAADRGEITETRARMMLIDYLAPSLDTTINATSAAIELFAANPDQWTKLRSRPELIPHAINEAVRLESPIRAFSRVVACDTVFEGVALERGARVYMLYACANRDERRYREPERFDIERKPGDHMGFGAGTHLCAGMHLAKLEMTMLLEALIRRVASFQVREVERRAHNTLRGLHRLDVSVVTDRTN